MPDPAHRPLLGSYRTPRFKYGARAFCEVRGEVVLVGLSAGPIPRTATAGCATCAPALATTHGEAMLPDQVFDRLEGGKGFLDVGRFYRSLREAEEALLAAWAKARAAGWAPEQ
jgi:hypothetical protein